MAHSRYATCGLWDNGSVYCWGSNTYGKLGDGTVCEPGMYENNCNGNGAKPIIHDPVIFPTGESAMAIWPRLVPNKALLLHSVDIRRYMVLGEWFSNENRGI